MEKEDPIFKKIYIPKIRLVENLFYTSNIEDDVSFLFEKFESIIDNKPVRPGEGNYTIMEKFA